VIDFVVKRVHSCCFSTRSTLMPSFLASARMACLTTAVCVIPSRSERAFSVRLSSSLKRMVVVVFIMLDIVSHLLYNASTWKPLRYRRGVLVVASSARKNACGAGSAGSAMSETACVEASTEVWLSRFTTF